MADRLAIALATCATLPEPDPDAAPLADALERAGLTFNLLAWDSPPMATSAPRMTILRSTWNYPEQPEEFLAWATSVAASSDLWNPLPIVRWNLHKRYLTVLASLGIPVIPTALVTKGSTTSLREIVLGRHWRDIVLKPAISAASKDTRRYDARSDSADAHYRDILSRGDVLVQPYLSSVETYGERALIWIDGEVTHAVRKRRRLQGDVESVTHAEPSPAEAALARRVIEAVQTSLATTLLYGRVDVTPDANGDLLVMELELIEPSLYFAECPQALDRFVAGIKKRLATLQA